MHLQSRRGGSTGARGTKKQAQEHKKKAAKRSSGGLKYHSSTGFPWQPFFALYLDIADKLSMRAVAE
ncbi:hypothetical protein KDH_42530 [Dictyobacter sp. S3.2.2.5]|uniref:Uncharacterized protein n=1 Tax=Dictyobacter halimunensis TaxID=3026934 RepID=A0ABQ6FT42_9CHLR|nr:hypothetical protein KDH_42530 [Dictyobacter sp. S3.2.2.5]